MFSNTEYLYVKDLTQSFYDKGYTNYVCYTNNPSNSYNTQYYDIFCYYSKSNISQNNLVFSLPGNTKKCSINTKSSTSNYKNTSLTCTDSSDSSITIDNKEFIYSNVGYNSDIIADYTGTKIYHNQSVLFLSSILAVLVIIFLYQFTIKLFRR